MKRLLSLVLSLIAILSLNAVALAAEDEISVEAATDTEASIIPIDEVIDASELKYFRIPVVGEDSPMLMTAVDGNGNITVVELPILGSADGSVDSPDSEVIDADDVEYFEIPEIHPCRGCLQRNAREATYASCLESGVEWNPEPYDGPTCEICEKYFLREQELVQSQKPNGDLPQPPEKPPVVIEPTDETGDEKLHKITVEIDGRVVGDEDQTTHFGASGVTASGSRSDVSYRLNQLLQVRLATWQEYIESHANDSQSIFWRLLVAYANGRRANVH